MDDEPEVAERAGLGDDSTEDRRAAKKGFFPSSMGLSFLVNEGVDALEVLVRWGDYCRVEAESGDPNRDRAGQGGEAGAERDQRETPADQRAGESESGDGTGGEGRHAEQAGTGPDGTGQSQVRSWWQRTPREESVPVTLPATTGDPRPHPGPNSGGLILHAVARPVDAASFAGRIAPGTRSVSLFLVNDRIAARPKVYFDPRSLEMGSPTGVLHAKAVVADEESVFITSANLTAAAWDRNIELGLLVRDRALAATTVIHFRTLIEKDLL